MHRMKALGYRQPSPIDHPESLIELEVATPEPRPRDLRVRVRAISVNPVDVKLRAGAAPPAGQARILGFDAAGIVEAVGEQVTMFRLGDEVFYAGAIDRPGANAELHVVDERIVAHKPRTLSFAEAAALPLTSITAWELLFDRLRVAREERGTLLVVGGAGGVGSVLIQLARKLTALTVVATASRPETRQWCLDLGAHHVVDHTKPLADELAASGVAAPRLIASLTATDRHWPALCVLLAPQGRIALIDDPKTLDVMPLKRKSASVHWEFMFARPLFETDDMIEQHRLLTEVARLVDAGAVRTTLTEHLGPLSVDTLREAHRRVESGRVRGKLVLDGF